MQPSKDNGTRSKPNTTCHYRVGAPFLPELTSSASVTENKPEMKEKKFTEISFVARWISDEAKNVSAVMGRALQIYYYCLRTSEHRKTTFVFFFICPFYKHVFISQLFFFFKYKKLMVPKEWLKIDFEEEKNVSTKTVLNRCINYENQTMMIKGGSYFVGPETRFFFWNFLLEKYKR